MTTPKRRSARLASKEPPSPRSARDLANYAVNKLSSLLERDETPRKQRSINAVMSSPLKYDRMPGSFEDDSLLQTPQTMPPLRPSDSEMHPSKVQQSTAKEPDSGLRLGFTDINERSEGPSIKAIETTPSKSTVELKSPGFQFNWAKRDGEGTTAEEQRILDSVREEAQRIKEQMQAQREEQARQDGTTGLISPASGRKLATPRRKGRFSDVHRAEFSKMESIADHVSGKHKVQISNQNLKRKNSKAELDDESVHRSNSQKLFENVTPAKRARTNTGKDVSSARPASRSSMRAPSRPPTNLPSVMTTPTKASLARVASAKGARILARIPHSLTANIIRSPMVPKSEGSKKYFSALARAPSMKSILHKALPKYSTDPVKIAAGTHVAPPKGMEESLMEFPGAGNSAVSRTPTVKRVGFALGPEANASNISPSPIKTADKVSYPDLSRHKIHPSLSSHPPTSGDFSFRTLNSPSLNSKPLPTVVSPSVRRIGTVSPIRPTVRRVRQSGVSTPIAPVTTTLPAVPHGMPNKKRRRVEDDENDDNIENRPPENEQAAKRHKSAATPTHDRPNLSPSKPAAHMDAPEKRREGITPKKKPVLSLSRLNALARPKNRA